MTFRNDKYKATDGKAFPHGFFYVDSECIACDTCATMAKSFFKLTPDNTTAYVYQQPQTKLDAEQCQLTLEACPVDAIGCKSK